MGVLSRHGIGPGDDGSGRRCELDEMETVRTRNSVPPLPGDRQRDAGGDLRRLHSLFDDRRGDPPSLRLI